MWWLLAVPLALMVDWLPDDHATRPRNSSGSGISRSEGYRPRPSTLPRCPPPGSCGVPPKPKLVETGCYRASRSVDPRTVRPPKGGTAVKPASPPVSGERDC